MFTGSFPGVKRPGPDLDHPSLSSASVKGKTRAIPLLLFWVFVDCYRVNCTAVQSPLLTFLKQNTISFLSQVKVSKILSVATMCDLYCSPNNVRVIKSRRMRWAGHVARMGEEREVYRILLGKPEGKRPLGRPRGRWVDNIRMDLQEVGCGYMDWIGLAQDRDRWRTVVSAVMNFRVP